jgi:hypothetical protein
MILRLSGFFILAVAVPASAVADADIRRYCGQDVLYDVWVGDDTASIIRSAEVRARCTIDQDVMRCDDGAEMPFEIDDEELVLNTHRSNPVVLRRCDRN